MDRVWGWVTVRRPSLSVSLDTASRHEFQHWRIVPFLPPLDNNFCKGRYDMCSGCVDDNQRPLDIKWFRLSASYNLRPQLLHIPWYLIWAVPSVANTMSRSVTEKALSPSLHFIFNESFLFLATRFRVGRVSFSLHFRISSDLKKHNANQPQELPDPFSAQEKRLFGPFLGFPRLVVSGYIFLIYTPS